ncbi:MAG: Crp/Fnr family transcriptional regulator [Prevotella sp.]|nr:Crp/Fnr family transcriptional regulator [Prevotella sp.]
MNTETLEGLMACPLFNGISQDEVIEMMHTIRYRLLSYRKGDLFAMAGNPCLYADIVVSGEMAASLMGPSGRIVRITMHHSGNMLAPAFIFAQDNHYPVTVEALKDTQVFRVSAADMERLLQTDSRLARNYIRILSNIISYLTKKVGMLSMTVKEKIELFLEEECKRQQTRLLSINMTRQEMADYFGIQKYSLQRSLKELQDEGTIRIDGRTIQLL